MEDFKYLSSIIHAAELAGGPEALAALVDATPEQVRSWTQGQSSPSTMTLLRILDVVASETHRLTKEVMAGGMAEMLIAKVAKRARISD